MAAKTGTYSLIASSTLGSAATVSFTSIPGTYTDLIIVANCRGSAADALGIFKVTFNSDTGSNYSTTQLYGDGSSAASARVSNQSYIGLEYVIGNNGTASTFAPVVCHINDYSNSTTYKTMLSRTNNAANRVGTQVSLWRSSSAITSIQISEVLNTTWASGSTFKLYGIEAGNL